MTLGLSRNNPWNLEVRHIPWMGLLADQPKDGPLAFETLLEGIRAGVRVCYTYQERSWNTPRKFVYDFADPKRDPVEQYLANVCEWTTHAPDDVLNFRDVKVMVSWARGVWRQEQGLAAITAAGITDAQIYAGIALAEED